MGKSKKYHDNRKKTPKKGVFESALGSDDETLYNQDNNDSNDSDDEQVNLFNKQKERNVSKSGFSGVNGEEDESSEYDSEEELLPIEESDDSESSDDDETLNRFQIEHQKDEMGSDLEQEEEDDLPDATAWGDKKSNYYSTDYVDKDFRSK